MFPFTLNIRAVFVCVQLRHVRPSHPTPPFLYISIFHSAITFYITFWPTPLSKLIKPIYKSFDREVAILPFLSFFLSHPVPFTHALPPPPPPSPPLLYAFPCCVNTIINSPAFRQWQKSRPAGKALKVWNGRTAGSGAKTNESNLSQNCLTSKCSSPRLHCSTFCPRFVFIGAATARWQQTLKRKLSDTQIVLCTEYTLQWEKPKIYIRNGAYFLREIIYILHEANREKIKWPTIANCTIFPGDC